MGGEIPPNLKKGNKMKTKKELDIMTIPELTAYYNDLPDIPQKLKKFKSKSVAIERILKAQPTVEKVSKGKRGPKRTFTGAIKILNEHPRLNNGSNKQKVFKLIKEYLDVEKVVEHSTLGEPQTRFAIYAFVANGTIEIAN